MAMSAGGTYSFSLSSSPLFWQRMETEPQGLLELVQKAEGHLGSVDRPLDVSTGHDSVGERLLITIVNLCS